MNTTWNETLTLVEKGFVKVLIGTAACVALSTTTLAQQGKSLVWQEDFGVVDDSARSDFADPNKTMPGHTYNGDMTTDVQDGQYCIANSTRWALNTGNFFNIGRDHTGNTNGGMLIVNTLGSMEGVTIYEQTVNFPLCSASDYYFSIQAASITAFTAIQADLKLQIVATDGTIIGELDTDSIPWFDLISGTYNDPKAIRKWTEFGLKFNAGDYKSVTLKVINMAPCKTDGRKASELESWEGCDAGNDFVLDDISLYRYDTDSVPETVVSSSTISSEAQLTSDCIYTSSYSLPDATLTTWHTFYPSVYVLWQQSEDGYTWTNLTAQSGVDAIKMQADVDITKNIRYRAIITGGMTATEAQTVADQIAANGGPDDGCYKFSISNTLAASKPEADCTYSDDLKMLWNDDFGTAPDSADNKCSYTPLTYIAGKPAAGQYVVTANPAFLMVNSWEGISSSSDHTGNTDGAMLVTTGSATDHNVLYKRTFSGPFCNCKTYMFSFLMKENQSWTSTAIRGAVLNAAGDTIGVEQVSINGSGTASDWTRVTIQFVPDKNYTGSLTAVIEETAKTSGLMLFDDATVRICGDRVPQDSIYINNTPGLTSLAKFDCNAVPAPTVNISNMDSWTKDYPDHAFLWQTSADGGTTWTTLTETATALDYANPDGGELQYRAIVAEDAATAASVANGTNSDACGTYLITNTVSLTCEATCDFGDDKLVLWKDNFGSVPAGTRKENDNLVGHTFLSSMKSSVDDGQYAVVSRMQDAGTWFAAEDGRDHTGNEDGGFLVINIDPDYKDKVFYEQTLGFTPCANTSYFFSVFASSISKRVANGDADGVLCNLTMQITDESDNVLASIETGDIPNAASLTGAIPWLNYGVSFVSDGTKIKLRLIDHAGNGSKGNDLALDDISLIACQTKAPDVSLSVDGKTDTTGLCGDSVAIKINDLDSWETIYPNAVYTLWQKSADGGETWVTIDSLVGKSISSITVPFERNIQTVNDTDVNIGYRYRVIVAGPEAEVTEQISKQGYPNNGCYLYGISDESSIKCKCVDPEFALVGKDSLSLCVGQKDSLNFSVKETGASTADQLIWSYRLKGETDWTVIDTASHLSLNVLPEKSTQYLFYGQTDECKSDSIITLVQVGEPITLDTIVDDTLCKNSAVTLTAKVLTGTPTAYYWNAVKSTDATYAIDKLTQNEKVTVYATDDICYSDTLEVNLLMEDSTQIAAAIADTQFCGVGQVHFDSQAQADSIQWYQSYSGGTTFKAIDGANSAAYIGDADSTRTYKAVAIGNKCPSKEVTAQLTVTYPAEIKAAIANNAYCKGEGGPATITIDLDHVTLLNWLSRTDTVNGKFESWQIKTYSETETKTSEEVSPTVTTQYLIRTPAEGCATEETQIFTVTVEEPIDFTFAADKEGICQGDEVNLNYQLLAGIPAKIVLTKSTDGTSVNLTDTKYTDTPTDTTIYTLEMEGTYCTSKVSKKDTVKVEEPIDFSLAVNKENLCEGEEVQLTYTLNSGSPANIQLTKNQAADPLTFTNKTYTEVPTDSTHYSVSMTGTYCTTVVKHEADVKVEKKIDFDFAADKNALCKGDSVHLTYKLNSGSPATIALTSDLSTSPLTLTGTTYAELPESATNYTLTLTGTYCTEPVTKTVAVSVEVPNVIVAATISNTAICEGGSVQVNYTVSPAGAESHLWTGNNGTDWVEQKKEDTVMRGNHFMVATMAGTVCPADTSETFVVHIEDSIRFNISIPDAKICEGTQIGSAISITDGEPTAYGWLTSSDGTTYTAKNSDLILTDQPTETTYYKASVKGNLCPAREKTFSVEVEKQAAITAFTASAPAVCVGSSVTLNLAQTNATALIWESKTATGSYTTLSEDLVAMQKVSPTEKTIYRVRTDGADVCKNVTSSEVTVGVEDSLSIKLLADTTICPKTSLTFTATLQGTPVRKYWESATGDGDYSLLGSNALSQTVMLTEATKYRLTAKGNYCPDAVAILNIAVADVPALSITADTTRLCQGSSVTLSADFDNAEGLTWYSRFAGELVYAQLSQGVNTVTEFPTRNMEYQMSGSTANGCVVTSDPVKVTVDAAINSIASDTTICVGNKAKLTLSPIVNTYTYKWYSDAAKTTQVATQASTYVSPEATTTYYVDVVNGSCTAAYNMTVNVTDIPHITTIEDMGVRDLEVSAEGGTGSYTYQFGNSADWTSNNIWSDFIFGATYKLSVKDAIGCQSDTTYTTKTYELQIPNFFTPDGNAENETWEVVNIEKYPSAKITIFDRYGKVLQETTGGSGYEPWDGTYNGNPMPSTDYWYEIYIHEIGKKYSGHFTLLRSKK